MHTLLSNIGRAFLKAFVATFIVAAPGMFAQPNLSANNAIAVAALVALIAGALGALTSFATSLTLEHHIGKPWGTAADSFIRAFVAYFVVSWQGWISEPSIDTLKAVAMAAFVGAINAGLRVVQGVLTPAEEPKPEAGITVPAVAPPGS